MGAFALSSVPTFPPLMARTMIAAKINAVKMFRSKGLPSRYLSVESTTDPILNQPDIGREPAINNQITGIHSALDDRAFSTRLPAVIIIWGQGKAGAEVPTSAACESLSCGSFLL